MSFPTSHAIESTSSSSSSSSSYSPQSCRQFTFTEIQLATQNFNESLVIGHGGFGKVYKGTITCGDIILDAAIKRLESTSNQGEVEFWAEVEMLSKLRHSHLVSLIGYCNEGQEMILVYVYMPNGTLADRLHKCRAPLTWVRRLKICIGAARGLDYLHSDEVTKPRVIHRDVKSSNILLNDKWDAMISDFGLSKIRLANQPSTYVNSNLVRGTFGYLDPDYYQTGRLTRKSDVYAFGVVLFEVLCAKQAVDRSIDEEHWGLVAWAQDSIKEGRLNQIVDSNLQGRISPKCLKEYALLGDRCLHSHPKQRPTMAEVVVGLEFILALQEEFDNKLPRKLFGRRGNRFFFPSNREILVGNTSSKSMDQALYTIGGENRVVHRFDFNTIVDATENFCKSNELKIGAYESRMYKGRLHNGQGIIITQYSHVSDGSYKACMNEASIHVKLEHENVIQLLGYCIDETNVCLIYDFALHATLDDLLFDPMCKRLDWNIRYKIIQGVAKALVYIHYYASSGIIHRVVRPANIFLDGSFNPKLSGFWLAEAVDKIDNIRYEETCGVFGYIAPEYRNRNLLSAKADVFSFGVLVLETVTRRRMFGGQDSPYIDYVKKSWLEGAFSNIIQPRIDADPILMTKCIGIGLLCVQRFEVRPTMKEVVGMLLDTANLPMLEIRARVNGEIPFWKRYGDPITEDSYSGEDDEEFITELSPR